MANSIGEQLKQARTQRGLTLEQAAQATYIRKNYLEALENDQREALPSAVQGKGFLRLYADLLGLPPAPLLAAWEGKAAPGPEAVPAPSLPDENADRAEGDQPDPLSGEPEPSPAAPPAPFSPGEAPSADLTSSVAIFRAVGQDLRQQREALGLSLAEVERFTRLRQHYIRALEDGDIEQLPSPVQGRGMLSNYAEFLNMNEDAVLLRFAEGLQARRIERIPRPDPAVSAKKRRARQAPFWRRFLTPDLIFGVGVAVIILFFVLWTTSRISRLGAAKTGPTPPGVSAMLLTPHPDLTGSPAASTPGALTPGSQTAIAGAESQSPTEQASSTPVNDPGAEVTPFDPTPSATGSGKALNPNPAVTLTVPPVTTPSLKPSNNDPVQIYIVAHQRAWLRVDTDGKLKFLGRTVPGNAYAFSGTKRIEMLTGNAAALQVFYNGKDEGTLGSMGQAVGLVFDQTTIMTPTPAFTPTPTATKLATITPLPSATPQATATITPLVP